MANVFNALNSPEIIFTGPFSITSSKNFLNFDLTNDTDLTLPVTGTVATLSDIPSLPISPSNGGTGVANSGNVTWGGAVTFSGAFTTSITVTGNTSVTFPTSGTLATTAQIGSLPATVISTSSATMSANNVYITTYSAGTCTLTLPTTAALGTVITVIHSAPGIGVGLIVIAQNSGQNILTAGRIGIVSTTVGILGNIQFNSGGAITLLCTVADTTWQVINVMGQFVTT